MLISLSLSLSSSFLWSVMIDCMPCPAPLSQIAVLKVDNETMHRRFVSLGTEEERIYVLEMEQSVTVMEQEVNTARSLIMIPSHTFACTFLRPNHMKR